MRSVEHTSFEITRLLNAEREKVFSAFSEASSKQAWFACDEAMEVIEYSLDFRVGGYEINRIRPPEGEEHLFVGYYLDVVPEERIVYAYNMHVGEIRLSASLSTIIFRKQGPQTQMHYIEQVALFDGHQKISERIRGTELGFDMLERKLPYLSSSLSES